MKVKKALIPIGGLGTRFLPISKIIPKEFLPLGKKPILQHIVEQLKELGIKEFVFVISPDKERILRDYFERENEWLLSILKERNKKKEIEILKNIPKLKMKIVFQNFPAGDGDAILKAEKFLRKEPFIVMFGDDLCFGKESFAKQLISAFEKYKKPILCLYQKKKEELSAYGVPKVKKIGKDVYKILDIIEKPKETPPSPFALVGNYVLTPEIFKFLKETPLQNNELILANALKLMLQEGKEVLGIKVKGKWIECGTLEKWIENFKTFA
jgi:UTP--glucose-1-phosphate uridylyltransferase